MSSGPGSQALFEVIFADSLPETIRKTRALRLVIDGQGDDALEWFPLPKRGDKSRDSEVVGLPVARPIVAVPERAPPRESCGTIWTGFEALHALRRAEIRTAEQKRRG